MSKIQNRTSRFRKGDIVKLYIDYENNKNPIGKAKLINKISTGLPFILNNEDIIYNTERWSAIIVESENPKYPKDILQNFRIRYVEKIGQSDTTDFEERSSSELPDTFLTFNGIELF